MPYEYTNTKPTMKYMQQALIEGMIQRRMENLREDRPTACFEIKKILVQRLAEIEDTRKG